MHMQCQWKDCKSSTQGFSHTIVEEEKQRSILPMDPLPSLNKVYSLIQEEKQRSIGLETPMDLLLSLLLLLQRSVLDLDLPQTVVTRIRRRAKRDMSAVTMV